MSNSCNMSIVCDSMGPTMSYYRYLVLFQLIFKGYICNDDRIITLVNISIISGSNGFAHNIFGQMNSPNFYQI